MFDIGWSELLVIGVIALVVIGPKDLPKVLKSVGFWVRKARTVSREFQSSIEQMVREAELEDVKKEIQKATSVDLKEEFEKSIDPTGDVKKAMEPPSLPSLDAPAPPPATGALQAVPNRPALTGFSAPAGAQLRREALALALYAGAEVRAISGAPALTITHTAGASFDVARRYASRAQALAFQFVLDRLTVLDVIAWARAGRTIHITVSRDAAVLEPLLDRLD
jgi:sec-independent protein translocase protein TatB